MTWTQFMVGFLLLWLFGAAAWVAVDPSWRKELAGVLQKLSDELYDFARWLVRRR